MSRLVDALERAYRVLGFDDAAGGDDVFRHLVLARIIEPSSKLGSLRVLKEAGVANPLVDQEIRPHRTIEIQAGWQTITAADPLPDDLR